MFVTKSAPPLLAQGRNKALAALGKLLARQQTAVHALQRSAGTNQSGSVRKAGVWRQSEHSVRASAGVGCRVAAPAVLRPTAAHSPPPGCWDRPAAKKAGAAAGSAAATETSLAAGVAALARQQAWLQQTTRHLLSCIYPGEPPAARQLTPRVPH